ncbi:diphthine synthase [Candidatus Woesearchaeota archaeon]|nr:diphthine synthase [Candidatus Woesearchaeota archaeon]
MLYLIGIGLNDEKDISVKGLEIVRKADLVYLEYYTSKLQCNIEKLEKLYGKKITKADRNFVEKGSEILDKSKNKKVAFLVIGDVFSATTHMDLFLRARKRNIKVEIVNNASILNTIGITGLEIYKFGKITSISFENKNIKTPIEVYEMNKKNKLHTLFLLDLDPINNKYLSIKDAINYLIKNNINENTLAVACARIGNKNQIIKYKELKELKEINFSDPPYCLIIPGKLHFIEEEVLELWK